ncbi:MAG TPA: SCO family protein [Holophaga sp.]|nr:SCO family protein [Holophaga sp.]
MIPFLLLALLALPARAQVGMNERLGAAVPRELVLRDEEGRPLVLGTLLDRPVVLTLNYFRCAGVCTPQLNGLVDALAHTPDEPGRTFRVVTVSFDPRDTPAVARRKRDNYLQQIPRPVDPEGWRFLTGDAGATRALADAVGFRFEAQGEDFVHPAALIVLAPGGRVTRYLYGLTYLPAELQMAAQEAARGQSGPTVAKALSICFRYDPQARKHVFSFTRACGIAASAGLLAFMAALAWRGRRGRRP